jgi:predicted permease
MAAIHRLIAGLRALVRKRQDDSDLDDELRHYLETDIEHRIAAGASREQAARTSKARTGSIPALKDVIRDVGWESWLYDTWTDARYALRGLRRTPGFAITATAALAIGIGAAVTIFSVLHAILWRPLPYPDANQLVVIERKLGALECQCLASGEMAELRRSARALTAIGTANGVDAFLSVRGEQERVSGASVTDDLLPMLGAQPMALGRTLDAGRDSRGGVASGIVISHGLWTRLFAAEAGAVGRHIQVNNIDVEIVGVLPRQFRVLLPSGSGLVGVGSYDIGENVDVWFPDSDPPSMASQGPQAIARVAPNVTLRQVQAELDVFAKRMLTTHPAAYANAADGPLQFRVRPLRAVIAAPVERELLALGFAVAFVLLIAVINVSNLVLARSHARDRELATRAALGAGRARLVRQLLTESLVLAAIGGLAGLLVARVGVAVLSWLRPVHLPRQSEIAIDWTIMLVALAISVAATVACALTPALRLSRLSRPTDALKTRGTGPAPNRRLQRTLVAAEIALSIVPLVGAGLMLRSIGNLVTVPLGFNPQGIITANMPFSNRLVPDLPSRLALQQHAIAVVAQLPGVEAVSAGSHLPLTEVQAIRRFQPDEEARDRSFSAATQSILPGYLRVMGTPLLYGREFDDADLVNRRDVAIVDQQIAARLWTGNPIGQRFRMGEGTGHRTLQVIGVTAPQRATEVRAQPLRHVFLPYHLSPVQTTLVVRTRADISTIGPAIKDAVERLGTTRAVHDIRPMSALVADSIADARFAMLVLVLFATAALLLATIGLYGTLAYISARRTQEFGVRLALGATARDIVVLVAGEGAAVVAIGAVIGTVTALFAARLLDGLMYGVGRIDPVTLGAVATVLILAAIVAIGHPAVRASRVSPMTTLRAE